VQTKRHAQRIIKPIELVDDRRGRDLFCRGGRAPAKN